MVARRAHNPEVAGSSPVPATTEPRFERGFFFCLCVCRPAPRGIAAGIFLSRAAGDRRTKKPKIFPGLGEGQKQRNPKDAKNNDTIPKNEGLISSALVFLALGRSGALVFPAALRRQIFQHPLFFRRKPSPEFFISTCFSQGFEGVSGRRLCPFKQSHFWEKPPRSRPPNTPKNKWKNDRMTGKNKCPTEGEKTASRHFLSI